jgi:hypothetical protein
MFYNKKWLFFIILYLMSFILNFFAESYLVLDDFIMGYFLGSIIIFAGIVISSFLCALIISSIVRFAYFVSRRFFKGQKQKLFFKLCWIFFTIFSYIIVFVVFFEMIRY